MSSNIMYSDATELAELIRTRKISPVEVVKAFLDRIEQVNPKINAIVTVAEGVLDAAKEAEKAVLEGKELGPLHGVPFTVKDSIDTAGVPTQRGSPIFKGRIPDVDAVSVARMKAAGAILLAKTNLPEFSYSWESDNLLTGRSNNPWNLERTPGGSSGGESAAIAAGLSPIGLGTDLSISVRGPAAQTGITSLKATHGRVPMTGIWPRAPRRFWHIGPMGRSVRDMALAYSILAGPDGADAFATIGAGYDAGVGASPKRQLKVGWLVEPGFGPVDQEVGATVQAAAAALERLGCSVEPVRIPALERDFALDIFSRLHINEMKPDFIQATSGRKEGDLFKISKAALAAPETPMAEFIKAEQAADRLRDGFASYFQQFDVLLCPVLPTSAHEHGAKTLNINGHIVDIKYVMAATVPFSVTGLPSLSLRFGTSHDGLPINVQIVGSWHAESTILHVASLLEGASQIVNFHPKI
ncbi:amidase [Thozetella sp. PMI_491]|nr:amidase [Thozetella sp. PMI_491]